MEYTVASPEKGRWFNTPRAEWSWNAYRIPTQCAAIEALTHFDREADAHALRLWLLQAKRTQMWGNIARHSRCGVCLADVGQCGRFAGANPKECTRWLCPKKKPESGGYAGFGQGTGTAFGGLL